MSTEDRVRDLLNDHAGGVTVRDDYVEVTTRAAHRVATKRRLLVAALAAALVAGPAAGFAAGRISRANAASKLVAGQQPTALAPRSANGGGLAPAGPAAPSDAGSLHRLFARTTRDGVAIRVYVADGSAPLIARGCAANAGCGAATTTLPPGATVPPAGAGPGGEQEPAVVSGEVVTIEVSTDAAVAQGLFLAPEPSSPLAVGATSLSTFGAAEGQPAVWTFARVGSGISRVRAHFDDGATDEMSPVEDVVALGHVGPASRATLETFDAHGHTLGSVVVTGGVACDTRPCAGAVPPAVPAPPRLPPPGTPPADPTAARAAIEHAFAAVYTWSNPSTVKGSAIEGGSVLSPDLETQLAKGPFAKQVQQARARVDEVVFTTPTTAAVRYDILVPNDDFTNRIGNAVFVDGAWKVSRATVCTDLSLAGVSCPG
ncbi:MAG TPA: hypothetical protein VIB48_18310 [Acidimicrobiia bacterium]|jgi:hypothetical protein